MYSLDSSPITYLNRPYFDLGSFNGGSIHLYGIEISYRSLIDNTNYDNLQVNLPSSFRKSLLQETGLTQYYLNNPLQLKEELRTERWQKLCDYLTHYSELDIITQIRVVNLLKSLCLHETVVEYVPEISASDIEKEPLMAELALRRAISSLLLRLESHLLYDLDEFERIANHAPSGSTAKINAILQLIVQYAKNFKNLEQTEFWYQKALEEIENIRPLLDNFSHGLLMSIYYRAIVFIPLLHGNKEEVAEGMALAEFHGDSMTCKDQWQEIVAQENKNIILESRIKESLWLRNLDLAEEQAKQLVQRDPLDSKYYLELGEVLIRRKKYEEAAAAYRSAIRLGPPNTAISWYMAGQCYHGLGELDMACDFYLSCLKIDPLAICAVERLTDIAPRLGYSYLDQWSNLRLAQLQQQQQLSSPKSTNIKKLSYA